MRRLLPALAVAIALISPSLAQNVDPGPAVGPLDGLLGQVVPPAMNATYRALGQNITREDIRITLDMNFTKGDVNMLGLLVGSGKAEIQANIHGRLEMRVISTERIRALVEGENPYNMSAENATFLSELYLPAEVFRASLSAELLAAFQREEEDALHDLLKKAMPELDILSLEFSWSNVSPLLVATDRSMTEPPIVVELDLVVQYIRVESIPSLIQIYADAKSKPDSPKKQHIEALKRENGDPLRSRDFFAAAAYTQLLNLSMQPGWSLDINLRLPQGYAFTYFNEDVESRGEREASFTVDAKSTDEEVQNVFLASITHRKAVALALFVTLWLLGVLLAFPVQFLYVRRRLGKLLQP
jgi:hypothetical protein